MHTFVRAWMGCALWFVVAATCAQPVLRVGAAAENRAYFPVITAIYVEMGLPAPEFVVLPPERVLRNLENGELDADLGRVRGVSRDYANMVETTVPVVSLSLHAVVRKGYPEVTMDGLGALRIGHVRGTKLAEHFLQEHRLRSLAGTSIGNLTRMVATDRLDVLLLTSLVDTAPRGEAAQTVVVQPKALFTAPAVHVFHQRWAELVPRFDAAVRKMAADGRLARVLPTPPDAPF